MSGLGNKKVVSKMIGSSTRTVDRHRNDPSSDFPTPVNIGNRPFWHLDEIEEWIRSRPRVSDVPTHMDVREKAEEPEAA